MEPTKAAATTVLTNTDAHTAAHHAMDGITTCLKNLTVNIKKRKICKMFIPDAATDAHVNITTAPKDMNM